MGSKFSIAAIGNDSDSGLFDYRKEELRRAQRFKNLCQSLRRNDPSVTHIGSADMRYFPWNYSDPLGRALRQNTHLDSLALPLSNLKSKCLLKQISKMKSLNEVYLITGQLLSDDFIDEVVIIRNIFQSIASNPSISLFILSPQSKVPYTDLVWLLGNAKFLKQLFLRFQKFSGPVEQALVLSAIQSNHNLEHLAVLRYSDTDAIVAIIHSLQSHPSIKVLDLRLDSEWNNDKTIIEALKLHCLGYEVLNTIRIQGFWLDKDSMQNLVIALKSCRSVKRLFLADIKFGSEATQIFISYMRSPKSQEAFISDLRLNNVRAFAPDGMAFLEAILLVPEQGSIDKATTCTIGSSLNNLSCNHPDIWDVLRTYGAQIRLRSLLATFNNIESIGNCLPQLIHLNTLKIGSVPLESDMSGVLKAIYQNGSLHAVDIVDKDDFKEPASFPQRSAFSNTQEKFVELCCLRNCSISKEMDGLGTGSHQTLIPLLFASAMQTPQLAFTTIFRGLLSAAVVCGHDNDQHL